MSKIELQPPAAFDFKNPDDWLRWKQRFEQYRIASGLSKEDAEKQVSTLLYCLGEESEAVLFSTNVTEDERKVYTTVVQKLDDFFKVRKNVIYECARFNRRNQLQGETAEQYIMVLYKLVENCEYGTMKDEMIRDQLVVGIQDDTLSQKLQMDPSLTLEKAKKQVRQREAVQEQQQTLRGAANNTSLEVEAVRSNLRRHVQGQPYGGKNRARANATTKSCTRCGKGQHPREGVPCTRSRLSSVSTRWQLQRPVLLKMGCICC